MNTEIHLKEKSVYGNTLIYPKCETSKFLSNLANKKTFNNEDLKTIKDIGFKIHIDKL